MPRCRAVTEFILSSLSILPALPQDHPIRQEEFRAVIVPHRALSTVHYLALAGLTLTLSLAIQVPLVRIGAWPSALFGSCETLLLLVAVLLHRRSQQREEIVTVAAGSLHVLRRRQGRVTDARRLPIFGLHVVRSDDPEYGCQSLVLELRGKRTEIARDLSPGERAAFARTLAEALGQAGGSGVVRTEMGRSLLGHLTPGEAR